MHDIWAEESESGVLGIQLAVRFRAVETMWVLGALGAILSVRPIAMTVPRSLARKEEKSIPGTRIPQSSIGHRGKPTVREQTGRIDKATLQEHLSRDTEHLHRYITAKIPPDLASVTSADDILQEVWIAAFRSIANFRERGPDALTRWIMAITGRRMVDIFRTARALKRRGRCPDIRMADRRESSMAELFDRFALCRRTPSRETSTKESVQAVRTALAGLPDDRRRVIYMRHIEGCSVAEISRRMQKTVPAVNSLLFRARSDLCDRLGRASKYFSDVPSSAKAMQ